MHPQKSARFTKNGLTRFGRAVCLPLTIWCVHSTLLAAPEGSAAGAEAAPSAASEKSVPSPASVANKDSGSPDSAKNPPTPAAPAEATPLVFAIDSMHSSVGFRIRHLLARTAGRFEDFSGAITCDPKNLEKSSVAATIQTKSINTSMGKRDDHLRSKDFFDCDHFPAMEFKSTTFRCMVGDPTQALPTNEYVLMGQLTLLGKTQTVELKVKELRFGKDASGNPALGCEATTTISRKQFGLGYGPMEDEVAVEISIEALGQSPASAAKAQETKPETTAAPAGATPKP